MPFHRISEMKKELVDPGQAEMQSTAGEFMKVGIVTYREGGGPPPHFHPNEEQFLLVLEGKANMVLGEETRVIENGDLVHIPRNTRHGIRIVEAPFVFFTSKSPVGEGHLNQDYNMAPDAEELKRRLASA